MSASGLSLPPIKALHRHDGYISFAVKSDDTFCPKFAIRADALDTLFPEFRVQLLKDSFLSINAAYCLGRGDTTTLTGRPSHKSGTLRYLCACYCDIDFYNQGLEFNQAFSAVMNLCRDGYLPWASLIVDSGHGMWLLWLLNDANNPAAAHLGAYSDNPFDHLQLYVKINRALGERLRHLGADKAATDAARYIRVPGSLHMETENDVRWWIQGNGESSYSYTLKQLAEFLSIKICKRLPAEERALAECAGRPPRGNRARGHLKAKQNKLAVFDTLISLRAGGFQQGQRNNAAWMYAMVLRQNGVQRCDAYLKIQEIASNCTPPLSTAECAAAMKTGYKPAMRRLSYHRMADVLQVTPHEAEIIAQAIGKPFPPSATYGEWVPSTTIQGHHKRGSARQTRREAISAIVGEIAELPSLREMQHFLFERGIEASHVTIRTDYRILGFCRPDVSVRAKISQDALFDCSDSRPTVMPSVRC
jgi:hypothetical protein